MSKYKKMKVSLPFFNILAANLRYLIPDTESSQFSIIRNLSLSER